MELLFVPLCILIPNNIASMVFETDIGQESYRQDWWDARHISKKNNYVEHSWLFDQLPFIEIENFFYKIQHDKSVRSHLDQDLRNTSKEKLDIIKSNEPAGYHIIINGKNDSLEIFNGNRWVTPILPNTPVAYLLNLTSCYHRVKEDKLRTSLFITGTLDSEKHRSLINRSLKKYGDLAVYKQQPFWQKIPKG